jgi:hypothetical protein
VKYTEISSSEYARREGYWNQMAVEHGDVHVTRHGQPHVVVTSAERHANVHAKAQSAEVYSTAYFNLMESTEFAVAPKLLTRLEAGLREQQRPHGYRGARRAD